MDYKINTTYSLTLKTVNEYLKEPNSVNSFLANYVGVRPWKPHRINSHGSVKSIKLVDTGEIVTPETVSNSRFTNIAHCMFTPYELSEGKVVIVVNEPKEFAIMCDVNGDGQFDLIRGENANMFTLKEAKNFAEAAIKKNDKTVVKILKLNTTAKAKVKEVEVIYE